MSRALEMRYDARQRDAIIYLVPGYSPTPKRSEWAGTSTGYKSARPPRLKVVPELCYCDRFGLTKDANDFE